MQRHPIRIRTEGVADICRGATPRELAGLGPGWERDIAGFGPWTEEAGGVRSSAAPLDSPLSCFGPSSSTMDIMWALLSEGELPPFSAVISPSQHAGRGQLRRAWRSLPGNLYASVLLPEVSGQWESLSSLVAGYAVCAALDGAGIATRLKWPNDLVQGERKVGGLLIEERRGRQVMGLGINLAHAPGSELMRRAAALPAGVLSGVSSGGPLTLYGRLGCAFRMTWAAVTAADDRVAFLRAMEGCLAWIGRRVRNTENGLEGVLAGLAPDGGVRLLNAGGESVLYSGSIVPV